MRSSGSKSVCASCPESLLGSEVACQENGKINPNLKGKKMIRKKLGNYFLNELSDRGAPGAMAGLLGGIVFGIWMAEKGVLTPIASMAGGSSPMLGMAMHLGISMGIGMSFGMLFSHLIEGAISSSLWGIVYGFVWWFIGPMTLMPLMMGMPLQWTASAVAGTIPSLIWHLIFGGIMGVSYAALTIERIAFVRSRQAGM